MNAAAALIVEIINPEDISGGDGAAGAKGPGSAHREMINKPEDGVPHFSPLSRGIPCFLLSFGGEGLEGKMQEVVSPCRVVTAVGNDGVLRSLPLAAIHAVGGKLRLITPLAEQVGAGAPEHIDSHILSTAALGQGAEEWGLLDTAVTFSPRPLPAMSDTE